MGSAHIDNSWKTSESMEGCNIAYLVASIMIGFEMHELRETHVLMFSISMVVKYGHFSARISSVNLGTSKTSSDTTPTARNYKNGRPDTFCPG